MTGISGFMAVKDGIKLGYPFVEAILSVLPVCDEFLVVDGFSDDGTRETLIDLIRWNPKVRMIQLKWKQGDTGETIAEVMNMAKDLCHCEWCLNVQADEVYHEDQLETIRGLSGEYPDANSFRFGFLHFYGDFEHVQKSSAYTEAVRMFRNIEGIYAEHDGWTWKGETTPSFRVHVNVYHFGYVFPVNIVQKQISHAENFYRASEGYQRNKDIVLATNKPAIRQEDAVPFSGEIPVIMLGLKGHKEYYVREDVLAWYKWPGARAVSSGG